MTTRTEPRTPSTHRPRSSAHHAAWALLRIHRTTAVWFLGVVAVLLVGAVVVMSQVADPELSIVQYGRHAFTWYPVSMGVVGVAACLGPHVAVGRTRRGFARGAIVAGLVVGVCWSLFLSGLFLLEGAVFALAGWDHRVLEQGWFPFGEWNLPGMLLGHLLLIGAGQMSALLVAIVYQRAGGGWGTLALPLTAGPAVIALALLSQTAAGELAASVAVLGSLAAMVVSAVAFAFLIRSYTLDPG